MYIVKILDNMVDIDSYLIGDKEYYTDIFTDDGEINQMYCNNALGEVYIEDMFSHMLYDLDAEIVGYEDYFDTMQEVKDYCIEMIIHGNYLYNICDKDDAKLGKIFDFCKSYIDSNNFNLDKDDYVEFFNILTKKSYIYDTFEGRDYEDKLEVFYPEDSRSTAEYLGNILVGNFVEVAIYDIPDDDADDLNFPRALYDSNTKYIDDVLNGYHNDIDIVVDFDHKYDKQSICNELGLPIDTTYIIYE